jgi:hypothetical protein
MALPAGSAIIYGIDQRKSWTNAKTPMPGSPKNPAMITVTALTGKYSPVKVATEFKSHRQRNPQAELMLSFQNQRMGSAMSRIRAQSRRAGIKINTKSSIKTSV